MKNHMGFNSTIKTIQTFEPRNPNFYFNSGLPSKEHKVDDLYTTSLNDRQH